MRTTQEKLDPFGRMVDTRTDKPAMRNQSGFLNSRSRACKLDAFFADMLVTSGFTGVGHLEGTDGEGI